MTGCTVRRYERVETSTETIEQVLRPAVSEHRQTDILMENYNILKIIIIFLIIFLGFIKSKPC